MNDYTDVEFELPSEAWDRLRKMAEEQGITLDELVNNIVREELDKLENPKKVAEDE